MAKKVNNDTDPKSAQVASATQAPPSNAAQAGTVAAAIQAGANSGLTASAVGPASAAGLPAPVGTNDNGEPYWIINGQTVSWAQMQQYLFQQAQTQQAQSKTGGIEAMPQIPQMSQMPDQGLEAAMEQSAENAVEKAQDHEEKLDQQIEQNSQPPQPASNGPKSPAKSYLGDSAALKNVDTSDANSMTTYMNAHKDDPPSNSSHFLAAMLRKVMQILSSV